MRNVSGHRVILALNILLVIVIMAFNIWSKLAAAQPPNSVTIERHGVLCTTFAAGTRICRHIADGGTK